MVASQIRANARESLKGKWGKAALLTLTYSIIVFVIQLVCAFIPTIGSIALFVISIPMSYGLIVSFMKLKRGKEVGYADFLSNGFSSFGKVWGVVGNTILKLIVPICAIVILMIVFSFGTFGFFVTGLAGYNAHFNLGVDATSLSNLSTGLLVLAIITLIIFYVLIIYLVVKSYLYSLSFFILNDNPEMTGKEIVEESERLMRGNRWSFFWLGLTFIGWSILAAFTFGIGMLWLMPYTMVAMICFYENLAQKTNAPAAEVENKTEE